MDNTQGIDRSKPLSQQIITLLDHYYYVDSSDEDRKELDMRLGGRFQVHRKVARGILKLVESNRRRADG